MPLWEEPLFTRTNTGSHRWYYSFYAAGLPLRLREARSGEIICKLKSDLETLVIIVLITLDSALRKEHTAGPFRIYVPSYRDGSTIILNLSSFLPSFSKDLLTAYCA